MRKSFELLDWMKEHFGGNDTTPGEPGQPGILYRFTHGLKETGGVVKVDEGNGLAVNDHTGMLEVPIGEHLSYTSQGIDAKEGDTAQKGVVQLSDSITPESTHETAATPQAVKEYVDANAGSGGAGGIDMSKDNVFSGDGALTVENNDPKSSNEITLRHSSDWNGHNAVIVGKDNVSVYYGVTGGHPAVGFVMDGAGINAYSPTDTFTYNNNTVLTKADLADEQNLGVVKLTHTVSHGEHANEAVSPDGVAAYVDAKVADAGGFSIVKAVQVNTGVKLIDGSMIHSGKLAYGVLTFTCAGQENVTDFASLPLMPKSPFTVKVVRMSNNPIVYEATVSDNGTVAFSSRQNVLAGTYTITIAMQTK